MCGDTVYLLSNTIIKQLDIVSKNKKWKIFGLQTPPPKHFWMTFLSGSMEQTLFGSYGFL